MISSHQQKDRKAPSLSFTDSHTVKDNQKLHYKQFRSHEQRSNQDQQQSFQQKTKLSDTLNKKIEQHNHHNLNKHKNYQWQLSAIEQKRIIYGLKSKLKCKLPTQLYFIIRISFTQDFFKLGQKLQEGTIFAQLEELNFEISKTQKRTFQSQIQKIIRQLCSRTIFAQNEEDHKWVRDLLVGIQSIIQLKEYYKRNKKVSELVNRKEVSTKYILYHPPVSLTWSPKGLFCLTENKVSATKSSFIANPLSFKQSIEAPRVSLKTVTEEQLSQQIPQAPQLSIFNWNMSEELELFALTNHQKRQISSYYKDNSKKDMESRKKLSSNSTLAHNTSGNSNNSVKSDYIILEYGWKKLSTNMRKIYQRYFAPKAQFQYEITKGQKLSVYFVLSENRRYEDEMLYIMEKINTDKLKHCLEVVLSTTLNSYPTLLSSQNQKSLDQTKYFIITELLKEQRLKSTCSPFDLSLSLKSIMLQNQYHALEIQNYLNSCFKMLGVNNAASKYNIYSLGSYMHFDQYRAQKILIKLLQEFQYHYEMNLKKEKEVRIMIQSNSIERIKKHIKIKRIVKFPQIKQEMILSEQQRKRFIETILPVLLVRDINFQQFYYRQLQRIIATNQRILKFLRSVSCIIKKVQEQRHEFIKEMIIEYSNLERERSKNEEGKVRRQFRVFCQKCQRGNKTFEISQAQKLRVCSSCQDNKKI